MTKPLATLGEVLNPLTRPIGPAVSNTMEYARQAEQMMTPQGNLHDLWRMPLGAVVGGTAPIAGAFEAFREGPTADALVSAGVDPGNARQYSDAGWFAADMMLPFMWMNALKKGVNPSVIEKVAGVADAADMGFAAALHT